MVNLHYFGVQNSWNKKWEIRDPFFHKTTAKLFLGREIEFMRRNDAHDQYPRTSLKRLQATQSRNK